MTHDMTLYVGTVGQGIWRSTDGGRQFARTAQGMFVECDVRALAADPRNPRVLYAGTNEGCYRSTNAGEDWVPLGGPLSELVIWSLLVLPDEPESLLAGTRPAALFRSTDAGRSWHEVPTNIARECPAGIKFNRVTTLIVDPEIPDRVWAGVEIDGVWRSDDRGQTWTQHANGLSSLDIHGLAIVPAAHGRPRTLLAATDNDLNLSCDEGATWQPQHVGDQFPWPYCRGVKQRPGQPEVIFQGNGDGPPGTVGALWRSLDGARSWQRRPLPAEPNSTIWDFALHPADPLRMYAYSISGLVFASTDGGDTWEQLPRVFGEIRAMLWTPSA